MLFLARQGWCHACSRHSEQTTKERKAIEHEKPNEYEPRHPFKPCIGIPLAKRPRFHLHFTPTSASWINLDERWFAALTETQIRRGVHHNVGELETAIKQHLSITNGAPQAIRLDQVCGRDSCQRRPLLCANFRDRTLVLLASSYTRSA